VSATGEPKEPIDPKPETVNTIVVDVTLVIVRCPLIADNPEAVRPDTTMLCPLTKVWEGVLIVTTLLVANTDTVVVESRDCVYVTKR
jgi:hypothetical protein